MKNNYFFYFFIFFLTIFANNFLLANELEIEPHKVYLYLAWYNKDNSGMKIKEVPAFWMDNAFEYWTDLIETQENSENDPSKIMPGTPNVPVMNWECKYCPYYQIHCEGV